MGQPQQLTTKKATINDVAEQAGVSIKTVSRVLNREPKVRDSTRERVEEAMKRLNYRPNSPGRMLAGSRTYLLGLIYNANSSYSASIQNGVLKTCRQEHYDLLIHPCTYTDPTLLEQITELVTAPRVDGLLLIPPIADLTAVRQTVRQLNIPSVAMSSEPQEPGDWTVGTNDRQVCREMVRHLVRLGHQKIAFVSGHPDHRAMANRHRGYLEGMADAGLKVRKSHVIQGGNTYESGIDCAVRLLRLAQRPTAIFCANDHMAAGVIKVAHETGLKIPSDLSIAGFDDIPMASQIWPALTTVRQPLDEMASAAARLLIDALQGQSVPQLNPVVEATIVARDSTGPAPRTEADRG
ncbi:MAG: LacI family DNA-binding transcriptional regulator [Pseudomonadota bacterium]